MVFKNQREYENAAIIFWETGKGEVYYCKNRGNFVKIGIDGVTVCFCNSDGYINSYYKYPNKNRLLLRLKNEKMEKLK